MNKSVLIFLCALALALAPATVPLGRAQPSPAPAPAAPEPPQADPADESTPPAEDEEPKLRELGVDTPETQAAPAPAADAKKAEKPAAPAKKKPVRKPRGAGNHDGPPFGNHTVPAGKTQGEAVSIFGDTTVDGEVSDAAVSVLGSTTVNGRVGDAAVSVLGTTTVNGRVGGEVVAVLGDVILGPDAEVDGQVVAVLGKVVRGDNTVVKGSVQQIGGFGPFGGVEWLRAYVTKCVIWGRPLATGENLGWAWLVASGFLVFYLLLALIFPRGVEKSAEVLEERPGGTLLAALLTVLLAPILIVLLALTGVGVVFLPFLGVGLLCASFLGRAAVLAWFGRRVFSLAGGRTVHPVLAVLVGGVLVMLLYLIPFLGGLLYTLFGLLGLGMIAHRIVLAARREKPAASRPPFPPAPTPAPAPAAAVAPAPGTAAEANPFTVPAAVASDSVFSPASGVVPPAAAEFVPPAVSAAPASPGAAVPPPAAAIPPLMAATLPRAGFWIRLAASALDAVLVGLALALLGHIPLLGRLVGDFFPLWYTVYCVSFWQWRSTTIGGVICGLKVVRLDDRPIDWGIAAVRALGGFLSAVVAGLGFIWVSFDDERQSWHDKIAGTTVVRVPKGTSLL